MIQFEITREMILAAKKESREYSDKLKNSITLGAGTTAGIISEIHFSSHFIGSKRVRSYSHDLEYKGMSIEIKTKRRTVPPEPNYFVHIAESSKHQMNEKTYYVFYSLNSKSRTGHLCGYISSIDFFKKAVFFKTGEDMEGLVAKTNCYAMRISDLNELKESEGI